jgi:hypothetical protein
LALVSGLTLIATDKCCGACSPFSVCNFSWNYCKLKYDWKFLPQRQIFLPWPQIFWGHFVWFLCTNWSE